MERTYRWALRSLEAMQCHSERSEESPADAGTLLGQAKRSFAHAQDDKIRYTYSLSDSPREKIEKLCQKIYGAKDVVYSDLAKTQLAKFAQLAKDFYICLAKTQYSFSDNPKVKGAPKGYTFQIREIRLAAGSGFLIPIAGEVMTMPGLPCHPLAETIS